MSGNGTIGQIIAGQWSTILQKCNSHQIRHLYAIRSCRTPALGGHIYVCDTCHSRHKRYNSCRNRHCPQCQKTQKYKWIERQQAKILPCPYFHVVFTIPHHLNDLNLAFPRQLYTILFTAAWETLDEFGWNSKYLGAQLGATMILHTWGSNLSYHPHVHCIVPGGGISINKKWKALNSNSKFLFPVKAMSAVFRGKYIEYLHGFMDNHGMEITQSLKTHLYKTKWVVYAKPPPSRKNLINYLARYTHQIAITSSRIISHTNTTIQFNYKDYRHRNQRKIMTLSPWEFVRRFTQHILPHGFTRIRHYGILHSSWNRSLFPAISQSNIQWIEFWFQWREKALECPLCRQGQLIPVIELPPQRGPPHQHMPIASQNQSFKELVS